jgi:hypothetical protein
LIKGESATLTTLFATMAVVEPIRGGIPVGFLFFEHEAWRVLHHCRALICQSISKAIELPYFNSRINSFILNINKNYFCHPMDCGSLMLRDKSI